MKAKPERVIKELARAAIAMSNKRTEIYTKYIILHFRETGDLAPGCDARDLITWYEQNMPEELDKITMKRVSTVP